MPTKPADLYISSRAFFSILIPGLIVLSSVMWATQADPFWLFNTGDIASLLGGILAAYIVGYALNAAIKRVIHRTSRISRLAKAVRAIPNPGPDDDHEIATEQLRHDAKALRRRVDPVSARYVGIGQWSRRLVQQYSPQLSASFSEVETEVEFLGSMIPTGMAVMVAAVIELGQTSNLLIVLLCFVTICLFVFRFLEMRAYEERSWLTKALMLDSLGCLPNPVVRASTNIDPQQVAELFRLNTTVRFDWERYLKERWPTVLTVVSSSEINHIVGKLHAPWYMAPEGGLAGYEDLKLRFDLRPVSIESIDATIATFPEERRNRIEHLASVFATSDRQEAVLALGYSVGSSGVVILDGNHRLSALFMSGREFVVCMFLVSGPMDPSAVADTLWWSRQSP